MNKKIANNCILSTTKKMETECSTIVFFRYQLLLTVFNRKTLDFSRNIFYVVINNVFFFFL